MSSYTQTHKAYYERTKPQILAKAKITYGENRHARVLYQREYDTKNMKQIYQKKKSYFRSYQKAHPEVHFRSLQKRLKALGELFHLSKKEYNVALFDWARIIKKRDDNRCQICKQTSKLHAHHIFQKSIHPKLSLNINNGITLCQRCHIEQHNSI